MRIADATGRTLDLARPPAICTACLTDPAAWYSGHGILAIYCSHASACASWDASRRPWVITSPVERDEFVAIVAATIANRAAVEAADPRTVRH